MERIKPNPKLKQLVLLYVEDEEFIREAFYMLVSRYFKKVFVAKNGKEGLKIFKQETVDVIISDIKMPVMTGLDMAAEIKKINYEIPLIFTTAFGDSEYLQRAIEVGADGYIIKPIDRNKVFERLNVIADSLVAKKEVSQYLELIEILINYQRDGLILLDEELNIKLSNTTFNKLLEEAKLSKPQNINDLIKYCLDEDGQPLTKDKFVSKINSDIICQSVNTSKFFNVDIKKIKNYLLISLDDITEYKLKTEKIKESAMIDSLTKLYNRKKLDIIENSILNTNICLIMFDIDNFKKINDSYGHLKGDEVLQTLAEVVKHNVRQSDLVIRWGGEEFVVVLQGLKDMDIATNLAEKLRKKINSIKIDEVGYFSCSFGIACGFVKNREEIEKCLNNADEALYKAKRKGKNRVEVSQ